MLFLADVACAIWSACRQGDPGAQLHFLSDLQRTSDRLLNVIPHCVLAGAMPTIITANAAREGKTAAGPVKLFGMVIPQPASNQLPVASKTPASSCSDSSDTEAYHEQREEFASLWSNGGFQPAFDPALQPSAADARTAGGAADDLRSDSIMALQDAAATLHALGSNRSAPPAATPKPTTAVVVSSRRRSSARDAQLPTNMKACSSCREVRAFDGQGRGSNPEPPICDYDATVCSTIRA